MTFFQIVCIFINTNAIRGSDVNTIEIAQEPSGCLTFKAVLPKNRVWVSICKGLWDFEGEFLEKKSPAQFAFGFVRTAPRTDWAEEGCCSDVLSRS